METKVCTNCGRDLPLSEYYINKKAKDGKQSRCKCCMRVRRKEWDTKNKERLSEYNKKYACNNPDKIKECSKNKRLKKPEIYAEIHRKYDEKCRNNLSDKYIKKTLSNSGIKKPSQEYIELKRLEISCTRYYKQLNNIQNGSTSK